MIETQSICLENGKEDSKAVATRVSRASGFLKHANTDLTSESLMLCTQVLLNCFKIVLLCLGLAWLN